jgi:hypothetical protein
MDLKDLAAPLSAAELDTMRRLFIGGPTSDADMQSKEGCESLVARGLAEHDRGHAWLTREGVHASFEFEFHRIKAALQFARRGS